MKMNFISSSVILVTCYVSILVKASNILIFAPSPWKSHIISFQPLFLELANRGHNVTIVTKFPIKNPPSNITQVIALYEYDLGEISELVLQGSNKYRFFFNEMYDRNIALTETTKTFISCPEVQKFIKEDRSTFDLVIVESFFQECTIAISHKYGAPVVSYIPVAPWITPSLQAANPSDYSYIKDFALNGGKSLDFKNRVINTLFGLYGLFIEPLFYLPKMEKMMNTYFQYPGYENRPSMTEMLKNISLRLIDSDIMILSPRPYVPSFIEVPGVHLQPTKKINKNLQQFLDTASTGFVYFNFGTLINLADFPKSYLDIFINVLGRLEQKVVYKWITNNTRKFPNNFYVDSWLQQREILKHPNCKLFITHGGIHGLMESIDAGIPLIGFPFFGDQFQNLKTSQENGFAIMSDMFTMTEKTFERDVNLVLTNTEFTKNAKRMSSIFQDRPMSTLDKAVYWIEYVIRHNGAHHLRSAAVKLTWYQYYSLDTISFLIFVTILFIFMCYFITKNITKSILKLLVNPIKIKRS